MPIVRRRLPADQLHEIYRAHVGAVYAFFAYSVSHHVAEDLTATTFERVVRHWGRYDASLSNERTWILVIARNVLADYFRAQRHRAGPSLDEYPELADSIAAGEDPADRQASAETVKEWLNRLTTREREVLALRYGADLALRDIARTLGISEANVQQISSRAIRRLRHHLANEELQDSA